MADPSGDTGPGSGARSGGGLDEFARELASASGSDERLSIGIGLSLEMVRGCDHAGVTQATKTGFSTPVASDEVARRGDQWQYELSEGPCVNTVRQQETVLSLDLRHEPRWPRWAPRMVAELEVRSSLSLLLYTNERSYGAINLYGHRIGAFDSADLAVAHSIAAHLAVSMAAGTEIAQLGIAVSSRTVIGQAEGIVMERLQINADQAFNYLRRISSHTNRKLVDVATELVRTRQLPTPIKEAGSAEDR